jgi:hypothetical protein
MMTEFPWMLSLNDLHFPLSANVFIGCKFSLFLVDLVPTVKNHFSLYISINSSKSTSKEQTEVPNKMLMSN